MKLSAQWGDWKTSIFRQGSQVEPYVTRSHSPAFSNALVCLFFIRIPQHCSSPGWFHKRLLKQLNSLRLLRQVLDYADPVMSICSIYVALDGMCTATKMHIASIQSRGDNTGNRTCLKRAISWMCGSRWRFERIAGLFQSRFSKQSTQAPHRPNHPRLVSPSP